MIKDWTDIMAVNLDGMFNVTHAFLATLRATKGRIVNIASVQSFAHMRTFFKNGTDLRPRGALARAC